MAHRTWWRWWLAIPIATAAFGQSSPPVTAENIRQELDQSWVQLEASAREKRLFGKEGDCQWARFQLDPSKAQGREVTVREILDVAARRIEGQFERQPGVEAQLRQTIGDAYLSLSRYDDALQQLERAHRMAVDQYGDDSIDRHR